MSGVFEQAIVTLREQLEETFHLQRESPEGISSRKDQLATCVAFEMSMFSVSRDGNDCIFWSSYAFRVVLEAENLARSSLTVTKGSRGCIIGLPKSTNFFHLVDEVG